MQIPQAPGIEAYLAPGRPDIAGAFTRGAALGQQARERQERKKELDAERAYRIDRDRSELLGRFGGDAVIDPESGVIDPGASLARREERLRQEQIARAMGEASVFDPKLQVPPGMDQNPAFNLGRAAAEARRIESDATTERAAARALAEIQARNQGMVERERVQQEAQTLRDAEKRAAELAESAAARRRVKVVEGPLGRTVTRTLDGDEADAAMRAPVSPADQAAKEQMDAINEALALAQQMRAAGQNIDLDIDDKGKPTISKSRAFHDNERAIEMLRRMQQQAGGGRTSTAPVRLDQLP